MIAIALVRKTAVTRSL